jgi:class 3 adenylate cyclase
MTAGNRIVDISEDAVAVRRRRRRALFRIGVPILGITLVIAAILGIALYSHNANRRGVLALSDEFLNTLDAQIAQRVAAFLEPCERSLRIMRDIAVHMPPGERRDTAERFAVSVLKESPQIAAFYVGDKAGDFLMVRRQGDGVEIKQITNDETGRRVVLTERDAAGVETKRREDPTDDYDPRTRPWFEGALSADDLFWTSVYTFFTDRKPGITASARIPDASGMDRVLGVDVTLEELSRFLATLQIGAHGRSLIMDDQGRLIAVSNSEKTIQPTGDQFVPPKVDELNDAVLTAAFDRFRVEGQGRRIIEHDGVRYISSATPLSGASHKWWILIVVPEDDFIGFVASNNRTALAMSLSIVLAVVVLAVLLVRQGLKSDRSARLMTVRGRLMSQQSAAYAAISEETARGTSEAPQALTEGLIAVTGAWRASVWRLAAGNQTLRCPDSYERDSQGHAGGFELHRRELPAFFAFLESGEELSVSDAANDRRTAQFHKIIMQSLGSQALTVIPIRRGEQVIGAICLEDPGTLEGTKDFLRTVASMFSSTIKIAPQDADQPVANLPARDAPATAEPQRAQAVSAIRPILSADLGPSAIDHANLRAEYFPAMSVMVLRLSGSLALAKKTGAGDAGMAVQIAELLQEIAAEHGVTYLKFVGQEAIAAAGFEGRDDDAMTWIAAAAIAIRDRLSHMVETAGHGSEFRIGLGFGAGYGCLVGREQQQFNLWGEALETANMMAHSAAPGAIQATAAAYARLRQDFLFRPRGSFYLPGIGQSHTFVLAGQL